MPSEFLPLSCFQRKYRVVPRAHPSRLLRYAYFHSSWSGSKGALAFQGRRGIASVVRRKLRLVIVGVDDQERKSSPKSKFWGRISRGRPRGNLGGRPGAKASVGPSKSWKNKHFGAGIHDPKARTSMTRRGWKKNFGLKKFGLNFRSLDESPKIVEWG